MCETPDEIAAATVISNTERLDPNEADYLIAVNRFSQTFKSPDQIGRILGLPVKKVRQLAKLGSVDPRFLDAMKAQKLTMVNLRKIARISDPAKIEALATQLAEGYLPYGALDAAGRGGVPATSPVARFVGMIAYTAAGGTVDQDLFEEQPDMCLDAELLTELWGEAIKPVIAALEGLGLKVYSGPVVPDRVPDGVELTYTWDSETPYPDRNDARLAAEEKGDVASNLFETGDRISAIEATIRWALASAELYRLQAKPLLPFACFLSPGTKLLQLKFYVSREDLSAWQKKQKVKDAAKDTKVAVKAASAYNEPVIEVDTEGYANALHETCSTLAGRSLGLTLANDVVIAFDAQLSAQFQQCVLNRTAYGDTPDKLLQISVKAMPPSNSADPTFVQPIVERLQVYKDAWKASDLHPFEWVRTLDGAGKADLFALITACQVSTYEPKTNALRRITRAEAAFVAEATGHSFRNHMLPDAAFYAEFSKRQLLGFLDDMAVREKKKHDGLGKPDLSVLVADFARERQFVPDSLDFDLPPADTAQELPSPLQTGVEPSGSMSSGEGGAAVEGASLDEDSNEYDDGADIDTFEDEEIDQ